MVPTQPQTAKLYGNWVAELPSCKNNCNIAIIYSYKFLHPSFGAITIRKFTMQGLIQTTLLKLSTMLFVADTYEYVMTQQYTPL